MTSRKPPSHGSQSKRVVEWVGLQILRKFLTIRDRKMQRLGTRSGTPDRCKP